MDTRRGLVAANWKMHGSKAMVDELLGSLLESLDAKGPCDLAICPPSVYLGQAQEKLAGSGIKLGAQNVYLHEEGAYTGEISARMLAEFDCAYVIVGHSERRALFAESDELVADKFAAAQAHGLTPILCVGETLEQREADQTEAVVLGQLGRVLERNGGEAMRRAVVAYEPVWAIGTGLSASPQQAQDVHRLIRETVAQHDADAASGLRILYGGSVKGANAGELFGQPDIDGALVGGASLKHVEFAAICSSI